MASTITTGSGFIRLPHTRRMIAELEGREYVPVWRELARDLGTIKVRDISCVVCMAPVLYEYIPWGLI